MEPVPKNLGKPSPDTKKPHDPYAWGLGVLLSLGILSLGAHYLLGLLVVPVPPWVLITDAAVFGLAFLLVMARSRKSRR